MPKPYIFSIECKCGWTPTQEPTADVISEEEQLVGLQGFTLQQWLQILSAPEAVPHKPINTLIPCEFSVRATPIR